jgi:hypothetical protein
MEPIMADAEARCTPLESQARETRSQAQLGSGLTWKLRLLAGEAELRERGFPSGAWEPENQKTATTGRGFGAKAGGG